MTIFHPQKMLVSFNESVVIGKIFFLPVKIIFFLSKDKKFFKEKKKIFTG